MKMKYASPLLIAVISLLLIVNYIKYYRVDRSPENEMVMVKMVEMVKGPFSMNQDEPKLLKLIRNKYLKPPSSQSYNLKKPDMENSMGQAQTVIKILGEDYKNGFFIECGGLDGETRSNTLTLEKMGWNGLLVEGDPSNYKLLLQKHRKAWTAGVCLSTKPYPMEVYFSPHFNIGKISSIDVKSSKHRKGSVVVQCIPIYSLLMALNQTTVDYFSLDVEGNEMDVLETIPWDELDIRVLSVEFAHVKQGKTNLRNFMEAKGYYVHSEVTHFQSKANDFIFVKETFKPKSQS